MLLLFIFLPKVQDVGLGHLPGDFSTHIYQRPYWADSFLGLGVNGETSIGGLDRGLRENNSRQWGRLPRESLVGIWQMEEEEGHSRRREQQKQQLRGDRARELQMLKASIGIWTVGDVMRCHQKSPIRGGFSI